MPQDGREYGTACRRLVVIVAAMLLATAGGLRAASAEQCALRNCMLAQAQGNPAGAPASAPKAQPPAQPAPAGNPKPEETQPQQHPGIPAIVLDGQQVEGILGKKIKSSSGEDMGRIVDVIVDRSGQVRAAVIDFGGFLGVGSRQVAVDWKAIRFPSARPDALVVDLTRDQVRVAPVYKPGEQIVVLGAPKPEQTAPANAPAPPPAKEPSSH